MLRETRDTEIALTLKVESLEGQSKEFKELVQTMETNILNQIDLKMQILEQKYIRDHETNIDDGL